MGKIADKNKIKKLFKSKLSTYRISQFGGMNNMTVYNLRKGETETGLEQMHLATAIQLTDIYDDLVAKGEIK